VRARSLLIAALLLAGCTSPGFEERGIARGDCGLFGADVYVCLQAATEGPSAFLIHQANREHGIPGSGCWTQGNVQRCVDIQVPEPRSSFTVAQRAELVVRGDARLVDASIGTLVEEHGRRRLRYVLELDLMNGSDRIAVRPGTYVLDVFGTWDQGDSAFYFGIRVVGRSE